MGLFLFSYSQNDRPLITAFGLANEIELSAETGEMELLLEIWGKPITKAKVTELFIHLEGGRKQCKAMVSNVT